MSTDSIAAYVCCYFVYMYTQRISIKNTCVCMFLILIRV
jgi:hypothetical protein